MNSYDEIVNTYNKGVTLLEKKNYKKAFQLFKKVVNQFPCREAYNNLGVCYRAFGQDSLMISSYLKGLAPDTLSMGDNNSTAVQTLNNLGLAYYTIGDNESAIKCYNKALKIDPKAWNAWWNCSTAILRRASTTGVGFTDGWEMYRARFLKSDAIKMKNRKDGLMYWDRVSSGPSIVVLTEQGIGDNIMFGRYLSGLYKFFDKVYVQCDSSLEPLFAGFPCVRDASDCDAMVAYPICSLGECFDYIPSASWLPKFHAHDFGNGFNVGIVWAGNPSHANDEYRSVNIGRFRNLSRHANLYSLTPGFAGNEFVKPLDITSWSDTASYVAGLDLVIGIDTSVMHLVGSMGCPGWLLQPYKETDFRWGLPDMSLSSSVWYDSIKVFNNPQSWDVVFKNVEESLVKHITKRT